MKYIYLVLTKTETKVSRVIRLITRDPYSHVSLSADEMLYNMYSFCRNRKEYPLPANFNKENIDTAVFGSQNFIPCEVYRIAVTEKQYGEFIDTINHFFENREYYRYKVSAFLPMILRIPYKISNDSSKFVCSVWVNFVLEKIGVSLDLKKHPSLVRPDDFRHSVEAELIYSGNLKKYRDFVSDKKLPVIRGKLIKA